MEEEKAAAYYDELTRKGEGPLDLNKGLVSAPNRPHPPRLRRPVHFSATSSALPVPPRPPSLRSKLSSNPFRTSSKRTQIMRRNSSKFSDRSERDSRVSDRNDKFQEIGIAIRAGEAGAVKGEAEAGTGGVEAETGGVVIDHLVGIEEEE
ncbi:hypothetical protein CK203_006733 [Vitis vinifera]|uniref:Uncharacterized protein n=1 Tax=Vitis vinifera TaxID=29760 RepID=A0A438KBN9_VITVI|nr:hypothetical protein CK203_006733 [Vitis vinifera]